MGPSTWSCGSAGNPPAAAPSALSVAQTQVPSASLPLITVAGVDYPAVFQSWSMPPAGVVSGPLQYGDGNGGNLDGCAPFPPGSLDGNVVLVDRGSGDFTLKNSHIDQGGGIAGIIGLIAPGAPFVGGIGKIPEPITIPGKNAMNSGAEGANPAPLTLQEYDGYLTLKQSGVSLQLPWHVLPRKASHVVTRKVLTFDDEGFEQVTLKNRGVGTAQNDAYSLLAVSPDLPEGGPGEGSPTPDLKGVGITTIPVPAGVCSANESFIWAFAASTWVFNVETEEAVAFFFAEHSTNTGNTVLLIRSGNVIWVCRKTCLAGRSARWTWSTSARSRATPTSSASC